MNFVSRWVVGERHPIEAGDLDAAGGVGRAALERWVTGACAGYVELCKTLAREDATVSARITALPDAPVAGAPSRVTVSAGATELLPTAVVVAVRMRFTGGHDDQVLNARCEVTRVGSDGSAEPLGDDVRDELIALEHAATFTN